VIGVHKSSLGIDVIAAIAKAKSDFRLNMLRPYEGRELINPQAGTRGAMYLKADVGEARPSDPQGRRGSRRLVLFVQSGQIKEMYFSDDHYMTGSWRRILDF